MAGVWSGLCGFGGVRILYSVGDAGIVQRGRKGSRGLQREGVSQQELIVNSKVKDREKVVEAQERRHQRGEDVDYL